MDFALRNELAAAEDRHWWFVGRRVILASVLDGLDLPQDADLLEAGCGNGANLDMLRRFGKVRAFEPDDRDRTRAERRGVAEVAPGHLPDSIPFGGQAFHVVLALDVIEHLDDDVAALRAIAARLAPAGRVIVTVPAHPFLWSRHDVRNGHRRRYTRETLDRTLRNAGLTVDHVSHFNMMLMPIVMLVRMGGRLIGADDAGTSVPPSSINRILAGLLGFERHLVSRVRIPFGVSLLAVARANP